MSNLPMKNEPNVTTDSTNPTTSKVKSEPTSNTKPTARTFVPNLSVRRSEVKVEAQSEPVKDGKKKPIRPNLNAVRGGRNARTQANLIQSNSIFEAGPAESTKRFGNERNSAESHSKVVGISSRGSGGVKNESTKHSDTGLLKVDYGLFTDDKYEDKDSVYIQLKENKEVNLKLEKEPKNEPSDKKVLIDLLNNTDSMKEKLVVLQIPENLDLANLGEGHIGKIKVYKSGKILFFLNGDTSMNVSLSVSGSFLQDAVTLEKTSNSLDESTDLLKMLNLGHVYTKLVCSPKLFN